MTRKARAFPCDPPCSRVFKSAAARAQHKTDAPRHTGAVPPAAAGPLSGGANKTRSAATTNGHGNGQTAAGHDGAQGARTAAPKQGVPTAGRAGSTGQGATTASGGPDAAPQTAGTKAKKKTASPPPPPPPPPHCTRCNRSFATPQALADHFRDSPKHVAQARAPASPPPTPPTPPPPTIDTPLDRFFRAYAGFPYDRATPPAASFRQLERFHGWTRDDAHGATTNAHRQAWQHYQQALLDEVELWFGNTADLAAWHQLCRAVGIGAPPPAIAACKKALRRTHVNIVDLIEWGRAGQPADQPVTVYRTVAELARYMAKTRKYFPKHTIVRDGTPNVVLRHLLRDLSAPGLGVRQW